MLSSICVYGTSSSCFYCVKIWKLAMYCSQVLSLWDGSDMMGNCEDKCESIYLPEVIVFPFT
jgi:hypothetical protein